MANFKKMTSTDIEKFFYQVGRKGKALSLPPEQLEKYHDEYDKIVEYLKQNYIGFIFYYISGGNNAVNRDTYHQACRAIENKGIFQALKIALNKGDVEDLKKQCEKLRPMYMETVNKIIEEDRQIEMRRNKE